MKKAATIIKLSALIVAAFVFFCGLFYFKPLLFDKEVLIESEVYDYVHPLRCEYLTTYGIITAITSEHECATIRPHLIMQNDCKYGYDTNFIDRTQPIEEAPCFDKPTKDAFYP